MDDSTITCDEITDADTNAKAKSNCTVKSSNEETETIPTNINEKNITCKIQNYILLAFLLVTVTLLIPLSI